MKLMENDLNHSLWRPQLQANFNWAADLPPLLNSKRPYNATVELRKAVIQCLNSQHLGCFQDRSHHFPHEWRLSSCWLFSNRCDSWESEESIWHQLISWAAFWPSCSLNSISLLLFETSMIEKYPSAVHSCQDCPNSCLESRTHYW
jgi:hypothetical protein